MFRKITLGAFAALASLTFMAPPSLGLVIKSLPKSAFLPSATRMPEGRVTFSPMGYVEFCQRNPQECQRGLRKAKRGPAPLTPETWRQLVRVNLQVNRAIRPQSDRRTHGRLDVWSLSGNVGDCEDYVLRKRKALIQKGWPADALLITTARDTKGRPHAVLLARTSRGDFVLDNLTNRVRPWNKVPYRWLKRQSAKDPRKWVALSPTVSKPVSTRTSRAARQLAGLRQKSQSRQAFLKAALAKLRKQRGVRNRSVSSRQLAMAKKRKLRKRLRTQRNSRKARLLRLARAQRLAPARKTKARAHKAHSKKLRKRSNARGVAKRNARRTPRTLRVPRASSGPVRMAAVIWNER